MYTCILGVLEQFYYESVLNKKKNPKILIIFFRRLLSKQIYVSMERHVEVTQKQIYEIFETD